MLCRRAHAVAQIIWLAVIAMSMSRICSVTAATFYDDGIPWQPTRTIAKTPSSQTSATPGKSFSSESLRLTTLPDPYTESWPNTIAICAIMFNETSRDVEEFLEYYRWLGVDSFYIRENSDSTELEATLRPWQDAGILDFGLAPGPKFPFQTNWYNDCAQKAAKKHSWVAFIDLDEFMVVLNKEQADTGQGALKRLLRDRFRYNAAVSLQWVLFGSSGHKDPPPLGQLEGFQRCTGTLSKQMKCLGNTYWFNHIKTFVPEAVHQCSFRVGGIAALGNGDPIPMKGVDLAPGTNLKGRQGVSYPGHLYPSLHRRYTKLTPEYRIIINHYVTRSQNRFIDRKIRIKAGVYATTYAEILAKRGGRGSQDELFAEFEHEYRFDGAHAICGQGARAGGAMRAAKEAGEWDAIEFSPGLLDRGW
eukprot:jgi/Ulvmu1/11809/UM080_0020.1